MIHAIKMVRLPLLKIHVVMGCDFPSPSNVTSILPTNEVGQLLNLRWKCMRKESGPQCPFDFKGVHRGSYISWGSLLVTVYKEKRRRTRGTESKEDRA